MHIILLEDEFSLRNNIKEFLELHHYSVETYADGGTFLDECKFNADLYILDINVPYANGFEVIKWISNNSPEAKVIFMTAFTDIESITKAYNLGCSDYLKKPFNLTELVLRVGKLLNTTNTKSVNISETSVFDTHSKQLLFNNKIVKLSKTQKNILLTLIEHKNSIVTYDLLISHVWENKDIKHNTIASHMREIRNIIPDINIQSIRSEGYLLEL